MSRVTRSIPGAEGQLGDQLAAMRENLRRVTDGSSQLADASRLGSVRASIAWHMFYADLLERACEDAATNVRTQMLYWKAGDDFKSNSSILLDFVFVFLLESPGTQKVAVELVSRTLSMMSGAVSKLVNARRRSVTERLVKQVELQSARARGQKLRSRERSVEEITQKRKNLERDIKNTEITDDDLFEINQTLEQIEIEKNIISSMGPSAGIEILAPRDRIERLLEDLSVKLGVSPDIFSNISGDINDLQKIIAATERSRRQPLGISDANRELREMLALESEEIRAAADLQAPIAPLDLEKITNMLYDFQNENKMLKPSQLLEFVEKISGDKSKGSIEELTAEAVAAEKAVLATQVESSGFADVAYPMLEQALEAIREQLASYQKQMLDVKLLIDSLIELRSVPEFQDFAENTIIELATHVNGMPNASDVIDIGRAQIPGRTVGAGRFRTLASREIELLFWALILAPMIRPSRNPRDGLGGMLYFVGLPSEAEKFLATRFADRLTDKALGLVTDQKEPAMLRADYSPSVPRIQSDPYKLNFRDTTLRVYLLIMRTDGGWRKSARRAKRQVPVLPYEIALKSGLAR